MGVLDDLLGSLEGDAPVREVCIGAFYTAVWSRYLGLASTSVERDHHHHGGGHPMPGAGHLTERSARKLATLVHSASLMEVSVGLAAVNALLEIDESACVELNAEHVIAERGAGKRVAVVGHFPFVPRVRQVAAELSVLELRPRSDDLPAEAASEVIPRADVVAITGTTLINRTFHALIELCRPDAFVLVLGPTTPLSPVLFDYGVDVVSGTRVAAPETVLRYVGQGATYRQIKGVRRLTMRRPTATVLDKTVTEECKAQWTCFKETYLDLARRCPSGLGDEE